MLARQLPDPSPKFLVFNVLQPLASLFMSAGLCFLSLTASFAKKWGVGTPRKRVFGGDRDGGGDQRFRSVREAQLRCWAHQARHASG